MERYRLLSSLGIGGAGRVVLVEDRLRPGSRVALKELLDPAPDKTVELHREFATLATLRHPSLVEVHELEIDPETGRSQLVMEYVEGADIVAAIRKEGARSLLPLVAETLRALAFLHDFGLLHRDLKPGNILVRDLPKGGHRIVVLDFGLAAERRGEPAERAAGVSGTLPYMAPELFDGASPTKRTDLYAIGVVIFEAVHGKTPISLKGNDVAGFIATAREGRRAHPPSPTGYPPGLARWLDEMLALEPADRPSSATDALARLNEACDTDFALETSDDRAARLGSGEPVGRHDELTALRNDIAPSGSPRVLWLLGDAGSGKSRILRYLASEAVGHGGRVHAPPGTLPASAEEFLDRVRSDASAAPTLVLLDELERADNAVATFVDRIAREPREAPVHVVLAARPGELTHPKLRKLLADTGVVPSLARVDLAPMSETALKAMIERASAGRSSAQARVKWLIEASEGNAGAAEALIVEGVWEKRGRVPVATALLQSIQRRMQALSPEARAWLEALAVLGDDAPEALIGELAGLEEQAGPAALEAIAAGLARRTGGTLSPDSRRAADAVKAAASPLRLRQLHALAATHFATLERDAFGVIAWRLARQWRGAGEVERALAAALDSASAAEVAKNWEDASGRLRFALKLLPRRDPRRSELWTRHAEALRQAMLHRDAVRAYGWAARWATDPEKQLEARAKRAKSIFMAGDHSSALASAQALLDIANSNDHHGVAASALEVISMVRSQRLDPAASLEAAQAGLERVDEGASELRASLLHLSIMARSRLGLGDIEPSFLEAKTIARRLGLGYQETMLLLAMAMHAERCADYEREAQLLEEAASVARRQASPVWQRWITYQIGRMELLRGHYDRALETLRAAEELAIYSGDIAVASTFSEMTMLTLTQCGRATEAAAVGRSWIQGGLLRRAPAQRTSLTLSCVEALAACPEPPVDSMRVMMDSIAGDIPSASVSLRLAALANELELSHLTAPNSSAELWLDEIDRLRSASKAPLIVFLTTRLDLVSAEECVRRERWSDGALRAKRLLETCSENCLPLAAAKATFLLADCLKKLGSDAEAVGAIERATSLLNSAIERIRDADLQRDFKDQPTVRSLLAQVPKPIETRRLEALYDMIRALNSATDPEALLEASLEMSMKAVGAERGMILLSGPTGADFSVRLARNLESETEADAEAVSRRIVLQAEKGESVLALDAGQDDRFRDFKSVSVFRIRSLMCVPLRSHGRIIGTVYLDSRLHGQPFSREDLRFVEAFADHAALALENARRRAELERENKRLKAVVGERSRYSNIVGRSPAMQRVFDLLERIANSDATILIQGESGTGKELVARALHFNGPRKDKAFLSENCAAIAETLLESELFGHVKGAFTGADRERAGVFEQAHDGTLFLDEVGDMSPAMQARLLRVLQDGELRRVGADRSIKVDVRVIAATNKDLQTEVGSGRFREDLYYRLAVVPVSLPPLRERAGDVSFLAAHLLEQIAAGRNRPVPRVDGAIFDAMERYTWPGNVRQLENLLRRMALLAGDGAIDQSVVDSDPELARMLFGKEPSSGPMLSLEKTEQEQIRRALDAAAGNRDRAARLLGISRATIYRKMREYDLR